MLSNELFAIKILTPHRMHWNCSNFFLRWIVFRICNRRKWTVLPGNLILSKNNPKKRPFWGDANRTLLTLGGAGGLTVETGSTIGVPLKTLGYNASNELCGKSVASKLRLQQADGLFHNSQFRICVLKGSATHFRLCYSCLKLGEGSKTRFASKIKVV